MVRVRLATVAKASLGVVAAMAALGYVIDLANQSALSPQDRADREIVADCKRRHDMRSTAYDDCVGPVARRVIEDLNKLRALR